jgi:hypothetical protein
MWCFSGHFGSMHHQWQMMACWSQIGTSRAKQWWTLQQPHICEFKTWIMINIDQQQVKKILVHTYVMLLQSFWLHLLPVANEGLWSK